MTRQPSDRDNLVTILAVVNGFREPLRYGQQQAVARIYQAEIDAILAAGWEPTGLRVQYEASQEALADLMTEHRRLRERLDALADKWETYGYGEQSGAAYAKELRTANET